jgi:hypothetical protein
MADSKISALTAATTLAGTDELVIATGGASKRVTFATLLSSLPIVLLADTTLGSAGQFDFTSISASYKHLKIIASLRGDDNGNFSAAIRFNNDSGANYNYDQDGTSTAGATSMQPFGIIGKDIGTLQFTAVEAIIPDYAGSNQKTLAGYGGHTPGASTTDYRVYRGVGSWASTAAITRITVFTNTGTTNFVAGSRITIYGLN